MNQEKYYIGKKQYIPEESDLLCIIEEGDIFDVMYPTEKKALYRTSKGSYFVVHIKNKRIDVKLLDETEVFAFMDENPAGIDTDVYDRIFGVPDRG